MSEGWTTAEAAKRGGEKCAGCDTGRRIQGQVCCNKCWLRIPLEMRQALIKNPSRTKGVLELRKWLRANKDGGQ